MKNRLKKSGDTEMGMKLRKQQKELWDNEGRRTLVDGCRLVAKASDGKWYPLGTDGRFLHPRPRVN